MRTYELRFAALLLAGSLSFGCSGVGTTTMELGFSGLPELGDDYVYEGWLMVDGSPVAAGRFSVDADSNPTPASFEIDSEIADVANMYVLTIEPAVGDDPAPSGVRILAGPLSSGTASVVASHPAALGTDFASAAGSFLLNTPSSAAMDDYANGIWFLNMGVPAGGGDPVPMAALDLPELPEGWIYEGWVVSGETPISTGTFRMAGGADSDMGGATAGPMSVPPFPGQDFVNPAMSVVGGAAVISVEPVPDNSPMPFAIKPLMDMMIEDAMPPMAQSMENIAASNLPSGSVSFAAN